MSLCPWPLPDPSSVLPPCSFVVLVTGTVVYGKGDEKEVAEEIAEGLYSEDVEEPLVVPPPGEQQSGDTLFWSGRQGCPAWLVFPRIAGTACRLADPAAFWAALAAASTGALAMPAGASGQAAEGSQPIAMSVGSMKSTMNIGSFAGSLSRSLARQR